MFRFGGAIVHRPFIDPGRLNWSLRRTGRRRSGRRSRGRRGASSGSGGLSRWRGCRCRLGLRVRVDPAGVNLPAKALRHLAVDGAAEFGQATEARLDMTARAAEAIVEIEVTEGRIEVVEPHQADETAAEPYALRIAGGTVQDLCGFCKFIGTALTVPGGFRRGSCGIGRRPSLILGPKIAALGDSGAHSDHECHPRHCNAPDYLVSHFEQQTTHEVPDGPVPA